LDEVVKDVRELVPGLWDVGFLDGREEGEGDVMGDEKRKKNKGERELHVSLSRPTYLRAHQREELKRAVKASAKSQAPCVPFPIFTRDLYHECWNFVLGTDSKHPS
jgi:hypothetical protein